MSKNPKLLNISQFAKLKRVDEKAVRRAIESQRLNKSVVIKGKRKYIDADLGLKEWKENTKHDSKPLKLQKPEDYESEKPKLAIVKDPDPGPASPDSPSEKITGDGKSPGDEEEELADLDQVDEEDRSQPPSIYTSRGWSAFYKMKIIKTEYLEKVGKLVPAAAVEEKWLELVTRAKNKLVGLPTKLSTQLVGVEDPSHIQQVLGEAINEALDELSQTDLQ